MGYVHPNRSIIGKLNKGEKAVVEVLADGLSDSWFIFTRQDLWTKKRPFEIDVLLMHEKYGFLAIEVKGGPVRIENGEWYRGDEHLEPSPVRQSQNAAYELRKFLRIKSAEVFKNIQIPHAVALPEVQEILGDLPPSCTEDMLFLNPAYENIESLVINCIHASGRKHPLTVEQISEFFRVALPTVKFVWDPEARRRYSEDAMTRISDEQVRALRSLDINDRVLVSGVAGSGKTRLAQWWAHQSARSGRSTLLTCYNDPLGRYLVSASVPYPTLTVGPFLRVVSQFPGIPQLEEPDDPEEKDDFWNSQMIDHLLAHAEESEMKFETIVIDERQDFNDEWMEIIEKLLVDENSKILCVADQNQDLYDRGFFMPEGGSPWALAELRINCRNTREIASFVQRFGGGMSASASLEGDPVKFIVANDEDELINAVLAEVRIAQLALDSNFSEVVVITGTSAERDLFYNLDTPQFRFSKWENRAEGLVACETVKRAKGIEASHVIFATLNQEIKENEVYVGASRARNNLVVIGPNELVDALKAN
jgi:hypothetical protein